MNAAIQRLRAEIQSDRAAWLGRVEELSELDLTRGDAGAFARAAVALHHGYGAIESALERIARTVEGSLPAGRDWHMALLESMALAIEGVRPQVLSPESLKPLRRLLAFRHFFRHAYTANLEADKLDSLRLEMLGLRLALERDLDQWDRHLAAVAADPG